VGRSMGDYTRPAGLGPFPERGKTLENDRPVPEGQFLWNICRCQCGFAAVPAEFEGGGRAVINPPILVVAEPFRDGPLARCDQRDRPGTSRRASREGPVA